MDSKNLMNSYPKLIVYLNENGYSPTYIKSITTYIRKVISLDGNSTITSYEKLFLSMDSANGYSENKLAIKGRQNLLGIVRDFDIYGKLPDRRSHSSFMSGKSYCRLNAHYKELIDIYQINARKFGKREETIGVETSNGSCFFLHLMNAGVETISDAVSHQIISFFFDGHSIIRGHSYRKNVKAVLAGNEDGPFAEVCRRVINLLPCTSAVRTNFPFLKDTESELLRKYIMDMENGERLRDRLITALSFFYGLRGSDITLFKYDMIDWVNDKISIIQSKTGEKLVLPLLTSIGNMLVDYLRSNPEKRTSCLMFTSLNCNGHQLEIKTVDNIVRLFMQRAGIRTAGGMTGVRVLRHHAATTMLRNGIKTPVISSILGHVSPESVVPYIDSSIEELQSCAIDISAYPIERKVFDL